MKKKLIIIISVIGLVAILIGGGITFSATYGNVAPELINASENIPADLTLIASDTLPTGQLAEYYIDSAGNSYMYIDGELRSNGIATNDDVALPYASGTLTRDQALSNAMLFLADKEDFSEFSLCFERENNGKYTFDFHRAVNGFATPVSHS